MEMMSETQWKDGLLVNPWISYEEVGIGRKYAQPDGLVFDPFSGIIYLLECKLTHTTEAYYQMNHKYVPLLEHMFPRWRIARVEIYKNMSGFKWPSLTKVINSLDLITGSGDYMWRCDL